MAPVLIDPKRSTKDPAMVAAKECMKKAKRKKRRGKQAAR